MIDFAKLEKIFLWVASSLLALSLFLLPLLLTSTSDNMYAKGYEANGAYERISEKDIWTITSDVQKFFQDDVEFLEFFSFAEKEHLEEVKEIIELGWIIFAIFISLFAPAWGLYYRFSYQARFGKYKGTTREEVSKEFFDFKDPDKKKFHLKTLANLFRSSGLIMFALLLLLALLASSWDSFFTSFHELFFSGQWMFETNTLMIRLWDHPFFFVAAKFIAFRIAIIAFSLLVFSYFLESVQRKVVV